MPLARRAWSVARWRDSSPVKGIERRRVRHRIECAHSPATARFFRRVLERQERQFRAHRQAKLKARAEGRARGKITPPGAAYLARLRACESGGNYRAVSPSGEYRGAYQFDYGTWASVGGSGDPADASPAEQDYRAAVLWRSRGSSPWPVCG